MKTTVAAYLYPGWHHCPERDGNFAAGWSEWDLVYGARPRFPGHRQPNLPLPGRYDDSLPGTAESQIELGRAHGVDLFVHAFFWSRGKRVLTAALDRGHLGSAAGRRFPFALMWANRMPRGVLPVKSARGPLIDPGRLVHTDPDDFLQFIRFIAERYFIRDNYFRVRGAPYLSIFDTSFFIRQLGEELAAQSVAAARGWLRQNGHGGLHLAAIDPAPRFRPALRRIGFDSVTHYVLLPEWKGPAQQDYLQCARRRARQWPLFGQSTGLPYFPSVSPGWDATPRAAAFGGNEKRRYPWSPVVTGSCPEHFASLLKDAASYLRGAGPDPLLFIASWNEWSEGHYLEPDQRFGLGWLQAVEQVARGQGRGQGRTG
jgi:hypothetical protein